MSRRPPRARLAEHLRHRQGQRHDHQRPRGRLDPHADPVGQHLPRDAVRLRVGADQEPCRRASVEAEGRRWRRHRARRARPGGPARADDADDRPRAAHGPDLRADLAAVPREPRPARRRVRAGRGTSCCTATWGRCRASSARGSRSAAVAGPRADGRPPADRGPGHRCARGQDPRIGTVGLPARLDRVGGGGELPRHRQAWRCQRRADPPRAAEGLGGQRAGRAGAAGPREDTEGLQQLTVRQKAGLARGRDRPRRVRGC